MDGGVDQNSDAYRCWSIPYNDQPPRMVEQHLKYTDGENDREALALGGSSLLVDVVEGEE